MIFEMLCCSKVAHKVGLLRSKKLECETTSYLLNARYYRDSAENKPTSLLVVPLGKARGGFSHLRVDSTKQMAGNS